MRTGLAFVRLQRSDAKGQFRAALKWIRKAQAFREFFEKANNHRFIETFLSDRDSRFSVAWPTFRRAHLPAQKMDVFVKMDIDSGESRVLRHVLQNTDEVKRLMVNFTTAIYCGIGSQSS